MMKRFFLWLPFLLPAYIMRLQLGPLPTTFLELAILALTAWWILERRQDGIRDAWTRSKPWHLAVALWIAAGVVSVIVSPVHLQALGLFRAYFIEPLLVFFIGFDLIRAERDRERLYWSFAVTTIGLALWAALQMATGIGIPHPWDAWPGRRSTGPFPFPNALALFVTPIAALAMARLVHALDAMKSSGAKRIPRAALLDLAVVLTGVAAILFAQSDGGLVAFAAAAFIAMILHRHARWFAIELAIAGLIAIAVIAPLRHHVTQIIFFKDWSGMVRTVIWKETTTMLTDTSTVAGIARPIFGAGLAAYPVAILPYHKATWMEVFQYPHTIVLNLWSEMGMLGIVAFGWIVTVWIRRSRTGEANLVLTLPVVTAILVHGLVDVPYFKNDLAVACWLLILLTTTYEKPNTH
jgi:hypothetical protein